MNCTACGCHNNPDAPGVLNFPDGTQLVKCEHCNYLRFNNDNRPLVLVGSELTIPPPSIFELKWKYNEWQRKKKRLRHYLNSLGVEQ